jgi:tetratricopeptide (TPR) repeat protein
MAEIGVVGEGLLFLAIAWGLVRVARRYRTGGEVDRIWLGTWAATIGGVGVASVANSTISMIPNITMVAVFTAAVAAHQSREHPPLRFHKRLLSLPLAAVLVGVPPLLPPLVQSFALHQEANRDVSAGRYADAVDVFRRAAAVDPLNDSVLTYFGDLLADLYLRRIDSTAGSWRAARAQAAELYERAQRLNPWDGYPRAALGRLRHAEGRYPNAVAAFRDAVGLDPYSPRYRLWLGKTLAQMGDRPGAAEQLAEAVRLYRIEMLVIERHEGHSAWYEQDRADLAEAHRLLSRVGSMAP